MIYAITILGWSALRRYYEDENRYDDMLDMLHHQSSERAHMSLHDRAAQFAPFAALSGH